MTAITQEKACIQCGKALKGRADKKFCDDYCRSAYNNESRSSTTNLIRNINNALGKNRRILESILPETESMKKITRERLLQKGFDLKYHTHTYTNQKGNVYFFCYEYGYLPLENDWFLVVKRNEEN
jgi:predicted nucleic acid-binding Zn ribbon protein